MAFVQVTLFYVALFTGMRESELIGLSWDCVDWDHETIHLYRQLKRARGKGAPWVFTTLKNRQDRTFTVPHSVMAVLQKARRKQAEWKLSHAKARESEDNESQPAPGFASNVFESLPEDPRWRGPRQRSFSNKEYIGFLHCENQWSSFFFPLDRLIQQMNLSETMIIQIMR